MNRPYTVLFQSIWLSCVTRQVDMAKICRLSQVTEAVVSVKKPLVTKTKIYFSFEPYRQLSIIQAEFYLVRSILSLKICSEFDS